MLNKYWIFKIFILITFLFSTASSDAQEWRKFWKNVNLDKYRPQNEALGKPSADETRVVFMGNSITEIWVNKRPDFWKPGYIGRGISGQTTPQMLLRYRTDVINLEPKVVVILAGINDIAENSGPTPIEIIGENIMNMAELAQAHDIKVIICSVTPAIDFPWKRGLEPANKIIELNEILKKYADKKDLPYVDYHAALKDENNGLKVPEYTTADDLVHPNEAGYEVMEALIEKAIDEALGKDKLAVTPLFSDGMVLQQKEEITIWGTAAAEKEISISASWGEKTNGKTAANGNWNLKLNTPKAGGPHSIRIKSGEETIQINDILTGEVWLASGQSNMSMRLSGWDLPDTINYSAKEIENAQYPAIREFHLKQKYSLDKESTYEGDWKVCSPETAGDFSASAYFFARRLHKELNIPIGIIHSSWGGTPAESWVSKAKLKTLGDFNTHITALEEPNRDQVAKDWFSKLTKEKTPQTLKEWGAIDLKDTDFAQPEFDDSNWGLMHLPGVVDQINNTVFDGAIWYRKTIELENIDTDYTFKMGWVDDTDVVYFNGKKIGGTAFNYSTNRAYTISKSLLKKGKNTVAIRIIDTGGPGSISGEKIELTNGKTTISLTGEWKKKVTAEYFGNKLYSVKNFEDRPNILPGSPWVPTSLYNSMIYPIQSFKVKGAVWYQGESNVERSEQYKRLFPALIEDWRAQWGENFPFYFVQIAPYKYEQTGNASLEKSQKLRDAQRQTLKLEKTGMVVTMDIGDFTNIHPSNKQDVGGRLAGLALKNDYGKNIVASGPLFKSLKIKKRKIVLEFDHVGSGLMAKDGSLVGFEIAGADGKFVAAKAKIVGKKVQLYAPSVSAPVHVRYAWRDNGVPSLFNKEGLPASSFSTNF